MGLLRSLRISGAVVVLALFAAGLSPGIRSGDAVADEIEVLVTHAGDNLEPGESECPSEDSCTLRAAIVFANADESDDAIVIRFDHGVFPPGEPATIEAADEPLPPITRANVAVDGAGAGVIIDGTALLEENLAHGIEVSGENTAIAGLTVRAFSGSCIHVNGADTTIGGDASTGAGNALDDCAAGITVAADGAQVQGNAIGLTPAGENAGPMPVGIHVQAGEALIGDAASEDLANYVGNATVAIRVGTAGGEDAATAEIRGNVIGESLAGDPAPVETGLEIVPPGGGVVADGNRFANAISAIVIVDDPGAAPSMQNTLRGNRYEDLELIAIDFGPTGDRIPNSPASDGPNGLQNHPEFERAVQAEIRGEVPGPCAGCTVDLYLAERRGSDAPDVPIEPIPETSTSTGSDGGFVFSNPPVSPGDWVMAIVTDPDGNTSEFSAAVRVGSGIVQCGNETMHPGWNFLGYFGSEVSLGSVFPPGSGPPGPVRSIHQLAPGGNPPAYLSWFASTTLADTLESVSAGEAYWFYSDVEMVLPGSFTLTQALPVHLHEGWNTFVYIGAEDSVENALDSIAGKYTAVFRYVNDGDGERWLPYSPDVPAWVWGFHTMEPCAAYFVHMHEDGTLTPLQP